VVRNYFSPFGHGKKKSIFSRSEGIPVDSAPGEVDGGVAGERPDEGTPGIMGGPDGDTSRVGMPVSEMGGGISFRGAEHAPAMRRRSRATRGTRAIRVLPAIEEASDLPPYLPLRPRSGCQYFAGEQNGNV
jgi:hypothetical protein